MFPYTSDTMKCKRFPGSLVDRALYAVLKYPCSIPVHASCVLVKFYETEVLWLVASSYHRCRYLGKNSSTLQICIKITEGAMDCDTTRMFSTCAAIYRPMFASVSEGIGLLVKPSLHSYHQLRHCIIIIIIRQMQVKVRFYAGNAELYTLKVTSLATDIF